MVHSKLYNRIPQIVKEEFNKFLIREFMQPSFSWETFKKIQPKQRISYCYEHLGDPIGEGSDRIVFDYDDDKVLKLASGYNTTQNKDEVDVVLNQEPNNPLLPKIYDYDAENFTWILTERVLSATEEDFERILGVPFYDAEERFKMQRQDKFDLQKKLSELEHELEVNPMEKEKESIKNKIQDIKSQLGTQVGFDEYRSNNPLDHRFADPNNVSEDDFDYYDDEDSLSMDSFLGWYSDYKNGWKFDPTDKQNNTYREWIKLPWFQNLIKLFRYQEPYEFRLDNFGIALRNNKPHIVVLDIGWRQ